MRLLRPEYLFQDKVTVHPETLSDYDTLDFISGGEHLYGEILWPDGEYPASRPCVILLTPFDPTRYLHTGKLPLLRELLEQGRVLQSDGSEEIYRDIEKNREHLAFPAAFDAVKEQNILILAGEYDSCAPLEEMVTPLWELLDAHPSEAIQRLKIYPAEHGLLGRRMTAITDIAAFLSDICDRR